MNPKLKLAFMGHLNEKGFAFPLAMLVGLIMLVTGLTMVMRSQGDRSKVEAQKVKAESLNVAEVGVATFQDRLNLLRVLATYPSECATAGDTNCWAGLDKDTIIRKAEASNSSTLTESLPDQLAQVLIDANPNACSYSSEERTQQQQKFDDLKLALGDIITLAKNSQEEKWTKLAPHKYYRLINYEYTGTQGQAPGSGVLTLESSERNDDYDLANLDSGTVTVPTPTATSSPDSVSDSTSGSTSTATTDHQSHDRDGDASGSTSGPTSTTTPTDNSESRNRLIVRIPVREDLDEIFRNTTVPGLWIKEGAPNDLSQNINSDGSYGSNSHKQFKASVAMSDKCAFKSPDSLRSAIETHITNVRIEQPPSASDTPVTTAVYKARFVNVDFPDLPAIPTDAANLNNVTTSITLPRATTSTVTTKKKTTTTTKITDTPNANGVYEYVIDNLTADITITPNSKVTLYVKNNIGSNGNNAINIQHNCSGSNASTCKSTNFQLYAYNESNATNRQICLIGNAHLDGFVFAPDYALGKTGNSSFSGSIWGKSWGKIQNCGSNDSHIDVEQTAKWRDLPTSLKPLPEAKIGQVTAWEQCAVVDSAECVVTTTTGPSDSSSSH